VGSSPDTSGSESRLRSYVEALTGALGHADRAAPFRFYCTGLLLPGARKRVKPMAARIEPGRVQAAHQSLYHFVASADWSDDTLLATEHCCKNWAYERSGSVRMEYTLT
jgi:SRSO17 transposase